MDDNAILEKEETRLKKTLTTQAADVFEYDASSIEKVKSVACAYSQATDGIAVISDYKNNVCHIYSGRFGQNFFKLPPYLFDDTSAFEDIIFKRVIKEDLLERHVLELRFLNFINVQSVDKRSDYQASCLMRISTPIEEEWVTILHTTHPILCMDDGSILCGLCTYIPISGLDKGAINGIINVVTGEAVERTQYEDGCKNLLSKRQTEILQLLAKGMASKQIAEKLCISQNTVNRHRQDILSALCVTNTAAAVETALRMRLL